jgi:hypothetical protein
MPYWNIKRDDRYPEDDSRDVMLPRLLRIQTWHQMAATVPEIMDTTSYNRAA